MRKKILNVTSLFFICLRIAKEEYCVRNSWKWSHKRTFYLMLPKSFYITDWKNHQILNEIPGKRGGADFSGLAVKMNAFSLYCLLETREVVIQAGPATPVFLPRRRGCLSPRAIDCIRRSIWLCSPVLVNSAFALSDTASFGPVKICTRLRLFPLFHGRLCYYWCCRKDRFLPVPTVFIKGPSLPFPEESALKPLYISIDRHVIALLGRT